MRICVVPSDSGGCGFYRLRWPAQALIDAGHDIVISDGDEAQSLRADDFDVIVFQRPLRVKMLAHIENLQAAGIRVVVDVDDDFSSIPSNNIAFREYHPKSNPESNWHHLAKACRAADLVTVTTPALAAKYGAGRAVILPNYVPSWYLDVQKQPNPEVTFGWSGWVHTHPNDLEITNGALADIPAPFRVVGEEEGVAKRLGLESVTATGWSDIGGEYQQNMANLDVGVVPLAENAFNRSKSWLKGLEFASLGVPFVASPSPEYERLTGLGAGLLADKPKRWKLFVRELVRDGALRREVSERGKEAARALTIEGNAWKWAEAWESAIHAKAVA